MIVIVFMNPPSDVCLIVVFDICTSFPVQKIIPTKMKVKICVITVTVAWSRVALRRTAAVALMIVIPVLQ
ncbi:MAG: hypothetical protein JW795_23285 [Chitinivibrionales bacterium]|nr:hypothetical protein [Chitinivibrionales bacterium]